MKAKDIRIGSLGYRFDDTNKKTLEMIGRVSNQGDEVVVLQDSYGKVAVENCNDIVWKSQSRSIGGSLGS